MGRPENHDDSKDDVTDELEELEGPAQEMAGEASASEDSLVKEQPSAHQQLGEKASG